MTEYIIVFRKPGPKIYRRADEGFEESRLEIDDLFTMDVANNIWHIAPVPPKTIAHPCPFPEEIPYRIIGMYSYLGDVVLDPFLGSGQTTKVAVALGRKAIGYDTEEKYIEYARRRISESLHLRSEQLIARFEKVTMMPVRSHSDTGPVQQRLVL